MIEGRQGFTIIEIMIVVTIIGILAVIAIPYVREARKRSQDTRFMNDLRILSGNLFDVHAFEAGDFPSDEPAGVAPPAVTNALPKHFDWGKAPSIGGLWDWDRAPNRGQKVHGICYAGLSVFMPGRTSEDLQVIDARFDDGNLNTGMFRVHANGCIYILAE